MRCEHCQKEVSEHATMCPFCGRPLGKEIAEKTKEEWKKNEVNTYKLFIALSIITAGLAIFFIPPVIGGFGIWLSTRIMKQNKPLGSGLLLINFMCTIIGIVYAMVNFLTS